MLKRILLVLAVVFVVGAPSPAEAQNKPKVAVQIAKQAKLPNAVSTKKAQLSKVVTLLRAGKHKEGEAAWAAFAKAHFTKASTAQAKPIANWVLRQAYLSNDPKLRGASDRVASSHEGVAAVRTCLKRLRDAQRALKPGARGSVCRVTITRSKSGVVATTKTVSLDAKEVAAAIAAHEGMLTELTGDAQLADMTLQNALQKQQQLVQLLTHMSKSLHDTAMSVIKNMGA